MIFPVTRAADTQEGNHFTTNSTQVCTILFKVFNIFIVKGWVNASPALYLEYIEITVAFPSEHQCH